MDLITILVPNILPAVIGAIATIIAAFIGNKSAPIVKRKGGEIFHSGGEKPKEPNALPGQSKSLKNTRRDWLVIILLSLVIGIVMFLVLTPVQVYITDPANGSSVQLKTVVRGTSLKIPADRTLWVFVLSQDVGNYYPQNDPTQLGNGGNWTSFIAIGIQKDTSKKFDIVAVLADASSLKEIQDYVAKYRDRSDAPGMPLLPKGATEYARITVTRL